MEELEPENSYVLCVDDGGYPESLEVRKVYVALPDEQAAQRDHVRVIDETGEDYLYPAKLFVSVDVSPEAPRVLPLRTRNSRTR
jgi:hypothetical protein